MPKVKKCKSCKQEFTPWNTLQKACSPKCALDLVNKQKEKERREDTRRRKRELRENDRGYQLKKAQEAFNAYIRERDKDRRCISCDRQPRKRNAGHYRSVGSHPELRFHPFNCNLQCEHCNTYRSGNQSEYRIRLIDRIGSHNVGWLEGPHERQNWSIDDIKEIKEYYREQLKILREESG